MMYFIVDDITKMKLDAIVNAANGIGIMGRNVAGAIRLAAGDSVQEEAKGICKKNGNPIEEGNCYVTGSGRLIKRGIKKIYHAVTMKFPGGRTSLYFVDNALRKCLEEAIKDGMKSIAVPGLGTGVGGLDKDSVAATMMHVAEKYHDRIDIYFVDIDQEFVELLKSKLRIEL